MDPAKKRKLKKRLDHLYSRYKAEYLESDPICLVHRYNAPQDVEIVGLLAALFAFGRVSSIIQSVERILDTMHGKPSHYLTHSGTNKIVKDFAGFQYRFVRGVDLSALLIALKRCYKDYESLGRYLRDHSEEGLMLSPATSKKSHPLKDEKIWRCCLLLRTTLYNYGVEAVGKKELTLTRGFAHLLADPSKGSACKRWFLFFRWMVRKDGVDFGIWDFIKPGELLMPVDTHIARISSLMGLTSQKAAGAQMVKEITDHLRMIHPKDPLKYDFAITRLGILRECPRKRVEELCGKCAMKDVCDMGNENSSVKH